MNPMADGSGSMFDRIAERYDLLNRVMSFGLDRQWRARLIKLMAPLSPKAPLLDIATGTADIALTLAKTYPLTNITGLDPSPQMLAVGQEKVLAEDLFDRIQLIEGDAQSLPFKNNTFDGSCIAFGIRNVPNRLKALQEMVRVTRSGGIVAILELSEPREGLLKPLTRWHVHHIVPRLGAFLSGEEEYRYLPASIAAFPPPEEFADLMRDANLHSITVERMSLGVAHLYTGRVF